MRHQRRCPLLVRGGRLQPLRDGLAFLPDSYCPHYDGEPKRRPTYRRLVGEGFLAGPAADDGAGVHFAGAEVRAVVSSRPAARTYRVDRVGGEVVETPVGARYLGDEGPLQA